MRWLAGCAVPPFGGGRAPITLLTVLEAMYTPTTSLKRAAPQKLPRLHCAQSAAQPAQQELLAGGCCLVGCGLVPVPVVPKGVGGAECCGWRRQCRSGARPAGAAGNGLGDGAAACSNAWRAQ